MISGDLLLSVLDLEQQIESHRISGDVLASQGKFDLAAEHWEEMEYCRRLSSEATASVNSRMLMTLTLENEELKKNLAEALDY